MSVSRRAFGLAIATIVMTALTALACVVWTFRGIRPATRRLVERAAPDVRDLSAARGELRRLETRVTRHLLVGAYITSSEPDPRARLRSLLEEYCDRPHRGIDAREGIEALRLAENLLDLEGRLESTPSITNAEADRLVDDFDRAASTLDRNLERASQRLAERVEVAARDADRVRTEAYHLGVVLLCVTLVLSVVAALAAWRRIRRGEEQVDDDRRNAEIRADEFEVFAARVAHDIRSPLAAVHLFLETAMREERDFEKMRPILQRATGAVDRVVAIVDALFEFARAGGRPAPDAKTDLANALGEACAAVEQCAPEGSLRISCTKAPETIVAASAGVVTSILANLLQNAIKYGDDPTGTRVAVRVSTRGRRARVEVCDNGPGVPSEVRGHMFEPHVRSRDSTKPGIGLGLATVRRLCEAHGGAVGFEPIRSGGSCFWFELPLARSPGPGMCASPADIGSR